MSHSESAVGMVRLQAVHWVALVRLLQVRHQDMHQGCRGCYTYYLLVGKVRCMAESREVRHFRFVVDVVAAASPVFAFLDPAHAQS